MPCLFHTAPPWPDNAHHRHDGSCVKYHDYVRNTFVCVECGRCQQVIEAAVGGYPPPTLTWYYNGTEVTGGHEHIIMSNRSVSVVCNCYRNTFS